MQELLSSTDAICTRRQLATILGITSRRIDTLTAENVLKPVRCTRLLRGKGFRLAESVANYRNYKDASLRKEFSRNGSSSEYEGARARKMSAAALIEEARARQLTGELLDRAQVALAFAELASVVKGHVLHIPSRCTYQLTGQKDPVVVRSVLTTECRRSLHEIATFDVKKIDRPKRARGSANGAQDDIVVDDD
jgi:phage terminase Nu1 subunit (DNA packaging protein)